MFKIRHKNNFFFLISCIIKNNVLILRRKRDTFLLKLRGGAVVARWAHNPKVVGSSPAPATNRELLE